MGSVPESFSSVSRRGKSSRTGFTSTSMWADQEMRPKANGDAGSKPMSVVRPPNSTLRLVGHDDVRVTMRLLPGGTVCVLDDLHQAVDVRILAEVVAVDVLLIVPVRHRPMLPVAVRRGQRAADQDQPHHAGRC